MAIGKSCLSCVKEYVCKFKPDPYMGTGAGGIVFTVSYEAFRVMLWKLYGENCKFYEKGVDE